MNYVFNSIPLIISPMLYNPWLWIHSPNSQTPPFLLPKYRAWDGPQSSVLRRCKQLALFTSQFTLLTEWPRTQRQPKLGKQYLHSRLVNCIVAFDVLAVDGIPSWKAKESRWRSLTEIVYTPVKNTLDSSLAFFLLNKNIIRWCPNRLNHLWKQVKISQRHGNSIHLPWERKPAAGRVHRPIIFMSSQVSQGYFHWIPQQFCS